MLLAMAAARLEQIKSAICSSSRHDQFVYNSFDKSTVRILKVLRTEPQIVTTLIDYQIHDVPEYCAVSYSWGTEDPTSDIICNTQRFHVTPHLYEGLRCISTIMGCQNLWIDAICIDQHHEAEKAEQVANMHQIFVKATSVLVWLGKAENDSDYAMNALSRFSMTMQDLSKQDIFRTLTRPSTPYALSEFNARSLVAFWHLYSRSWFRRLWTYQEAVLANDISLICGLWEVDWPTLAKVASILTRTNRIASVRPLIQAAQNSQQVYDRGPWVDAMGVEKMRESRAKNRALNFVQAVQHCRSRQTTEAVDRIYGLLGLCEGLWSGYPAELPVDYSNENKSHYWNLYTKFGKLVLTREPKLELLKMATSRHRPEGLPSWCPNLHSPPDSAIISGDYAAGWPQPDHRCSDPQSTKACRCTDAHPAFLGMSHRYVSVSPSSNRVLIWGSVVDVIARVGPRYIGDAIPNMTRLPVIQKFARRLCAWIDESVQMAKTTANVSSSEVLEAAATLHHNTPKARLLTAYRLTASYRDWLNKQDVGNWPQKSPFSDEEVSILIEIVSNLSSIWPGRAVFTTTKGRLGLASSHIRHGDKLCVLYSGPTIYLLRQRPHGDAHEFISDGFAHGLMRGEVFELMHKGVVHEQLFVIE